MKTKAQRQARIPGVLLDPDRRKLLLQLGALAVYTAPIMTTLLASTEAHALHRPGHVVDGAPDLCSRNPPPAGCDKLPANPCEVGRPGLCDVGSLGGSPEMEAFGGGVDPVADDFGGAWDADY